MPYSGTPEEKAAKGKEWREKNRERIAARDRARYLAKNPNAKELFTGTPEERFNHFFDPTITIPVDFDRCVKGHVYWAPGCYVGWSGSRNGMGYPQMKDGNGKTVMVHRWLYERENGPIPKGMELRHLCNQGDLGCLNGLTLGHLKLGSAAENAADRIAAGTTGRKLTPEAVREIRENPDKLLHRELGLRYGVSGPGISRIINRKLYREIP